MKTNILKLFTLVNIIALFTISCTKELEYGTNFNAKLLDIDNSTSVVLGDFKAFKIELSNVFAKNTSNNYQILYTSENVTLYNGAIPITQNNYTPFVSDNNIINLSLKATTIANKPLVIRIKDNAGLEKELNVTINVLTNNTYTLVKNTNIAVQPIQITNTFNLGLILENLYQTPASAFQIKVTSELGGDYTINNTVIANNTYIPVSVGNITATFKPLLLGNQTLTFTVKNENNVERQVVFSLVVNEKPFLLTTTNSSITAKETITRNITFSLGDVIPNFTYQVKFQSNNNAVIKDNQGILQISNTFNAISLSPTNLFIYTYTSSTVGNDIVTITVKDQFNQVKTIQVNIECFAKPRIDYFFAETYIGFSYLKCKYSMTLSQFGPNVTITEVELKIRNFSTNSFDVYTTVICPSDPGGYLNIYPFSLSYINYTGALNTPNNLNYHANQQYALRVKDSDGAWSATKTGIVNTL
ncbi:hypothetical protein [Flavobacterium sp.]|uniref:hypothetical protein n=1 Tax=Flavobacterium sp. TaxID=239 RepID=UPI003752B8B7